jgi:hypothetical protein
MMNTQHTPGPWEPHGCTVSTLTRWENGNKLGGGIVAVSYDPFIDEIPSDEQEANARLIAAAPDLLAACEACANTIRSLSEDYDITWSYIEARQAIDKATGCQDSQQ